MEESTDDWGQSGDNQGDWNQQTESQTDWNQQTESTSDWGASSAGQNDCKSFFLSRVCMHMLTHSSNYFITEGMIFPFCFSFRAAEFLFKLFKSE